MALNRRSLGNVSQAGAPGRALGKQNNFISVTQTNDITTLGSDAGDGAQRVLLKTAEAGTTPTLTTNNSTSNITFAAAAGTFTVARGGDYFVTVTFICKVSGASQYDVRIKVNGSLKHTKRVGTTTTNDPDESTTSVILSLDKTDVITVTYEDDGTVDIFPNTGTTINIMRIGNVACGGSPLVIDNNTNGYFLKSTGDGTKLTGQSQTAYTANSKLSGSWDEGAGNQGLIGDFSAIYFEGTDHMGTKKRFQIAISGGLLMTKVAGE